MLYAVRLPGGKEGLLENNDQDYDDRDTELEEDGD